MRAWTLALGIALDIYVAAESAIHSKAVAADLAVFAAVVLLGLWYAFPIALRLLRGPPQI